MTSLSARASVRSTDRGCRLVNGSSGLTMTRRSVRRVRSAGPAWGQAEARRYLGLDVLARAAVGVTAPPTPTPAATNGVPELEPAA